MFDETFPENTRALFLAMDILEAEEQEEEESSTSTPRVLPYRSFSNIHLINNGRDAFVSTTDGSKCKPEDLSIIDRFSKGTCPKECVAAFIATPNFSLVDGDFPSEECRFEARDPASGAFFSYRMPTSRIQTCHYHLEDGEEQLAGVCIYPAFYEETDSLDDHQDLIERLLMVEVEDDVDDDVEDDVEVDVETIESVDTPEMEVDVETLPITPPSEPISSPCQAAVTTQLWALYNFMQLKSQPYSRIGMPLLPLQPSDEKGHGFTNFLFQ